MLVVVMPLQETGFDKGIAASRQNVGRDPEALLELVETGHPVERVAQDQDAPPLPDPFEAAGNRTLHAAEAFALHAPGFRLVTIIMQVTVPTGRPAVSA